MQKDEPHVNTIQFKCHLIQSCCENLYGHNVWKDKTKQDWFS